MASGMTPEKLVELLDQTVKVPGLATVWVPPIRNRIDMLATGIKSPIGVKISGTNLADIDHVARQVEQVAKHVRGVSSALAERLTGGRYVDIDIDRAAASRYGLNIADVQSVIASAVGGETIGETVEGLARFPISVRYPRELRDSIENLRQLPILTEMGQQITLGTVARSEDQRGTAHVEKRERAAFRLGVHRCSGPRPGLHRGGSAHCRCTPGEVEGRNEYRVFRPIRVPASAPMRA